MNDFVGKILQNKFYAYCCYHARADVHHPRRCYAT